MKEKLDSILIVNDYLRLCKFQNPNCHRNRLVRMYLNQKLSNILENKTIPSKSWFSFIF
jgi:hypothetical protein